jgi:hypothetical protein
MAAIAPAARNDVEHAHAYRSPTVLLAPGVLFRTGLLLTVVSLIAFAIVTMLWLWSRLAFDVCVADRGLYVCALETPPVTMADLGVPLGWQEGWVDIPTFVPATLLLGDVVAFFWLIQPRTVRLDPFSRVLTLRHRRWPRRATVMSIPLDGIFDVHLASRGPLHSVRLIDDDGARHDVTGYRLGKRRQARIAAAIEAAIAGAV